MLALLLVGSALAEGPEVSAAVGKAHGWGWGTEQRFATAAVGVPVSSRWTWGLRGGAFHPHPGDDAVRTASALAVTGSTVDSGEQPIEVVQWRLALAPVWTPVRGRVSFADEAVLDLDVRFTAGAALQQVGQRTVRWDEAVGYALDDGVEDRRLTAGATLGVGTRAWLSERLALDLDARQSWWRGRIGDHTPDVENEGELLVRQHVAVGLGVTWAAGGHPEPVGVE